MKDEIKVCVFVQLCYLLGVFMGWLCFNYFADESDEHKEDYTIELLNQKQVEITTKDGEKCIISADSIQQFINKTQI